MENKEEKKQELNIIIPEKVQAPAFANVAQVNATDREVIMDFAFIQPNTNQGIMVSRVALTPDHAKSLRDVLSGLLKKYEKGEKGK